MQYNSKHIGLALMPPSKSRSRFADRLWDVLNKFDSEVSCRVSVLVKKFDCSCSSVAAAVSAMVLALCRQIHRVFIHCETAVNLAQLISYSRRQHPVKEAIRKFASFTLLRKVYDVTHCLCLLYVQDTYYPINNIANFNKFQLCILLTLFTFSLFSSIFWNSRLTLFSTDRRDNSFNLYSQWIQ